MNRTGAIISYLLVAVAIVGADLWSKHAVFELLSVRIAGGAGARPQIVPKDGERLKEVVLVEDWLSFQAAANTGAVAGIMDGLPVVLTSISIVAILTTFAIVIFLRHPQAIMVISLGLLGGGALGNLYDRIVYGAVRDFIRVFHWGYTWPNFNIADSAICTGVGLLFLRELIIWRRSRAQACATQVPETPAA